MTPFPLPLRGEFVGNGQWKLLSRFIYSSKMAGDIIIPEGFISDGASIPKIFYSVIGSPWTGRYAKASIPHDFLYSTQKIKRNKVDDIFYEAMKVLKVPLWKRLVMYSAVRVGGYFVWKKRLK